VRRDSFDLAFAAAFWAALAGGTVLLLAYFITPPTPLLLVGWLLFLSSVASAFTLAVIVSRSEGIGLVRALGCGVRAAASWVFWFLP
jgi:hypothetical protein